VVFSFLSRLVSPQSQSGDTPQKTPFNMKTEDASLLSELRFQHPLRKYQQEILELIKLKLEKGERQLHIVAPPGAGKTIMGLQLITELQAPALVVCPTTTIQAQWGQKLDLFVPPELQGFSLDSVLGTHEDRPLKPITLLTYQVLSTPGREAEYLVKLAHDAWVEEICKGSKLTIGEAELRVMELMQNNKKAYDKEIGRHLSRLRRKLADVIDLKDVLHPNAMALLQAFRRQKFRVVVFDECHHLTDYWAAVMTGIIKMLEDPIVIGLTGTPPEGKSGSQENRYLSLVGDIDYQVPTPALVREGGLAPFQDLVYFTEPTSGEEQFLEEQHVEFHQLLEELIGSQPPLLSQWVMERLNESAAAKEKSFLSRRSDLSAAMVRFAWKYRLSMPLSIELSESLMQAPLIDDWMAILEDFSLNFLKTSASTDNHDLYERIRSAVTKLGYGLTERGLRRQASPVDRVLAFSRSKPKAVAAILDTEYRSLDDRLRAAIVTDFEKMSATSVKSAKGVLTAESGGAVAVLRELLEQPIGQYINPCMVTGSLLLVDRRIADQFVAAAKEYLKNAGQKFELDLKEHAAPKPAPVYDEGDVYYQRVAEGVVSYDPEAPIIVTDNENELFVEVTAGNSGWEARLYVGLATELLERGITKCLVGTRGIFGEGWDCQSLNTLVDLTTTTTPMSVKQLRGRSIRINTQDPLGSRKVANNWDVVCIAPQLEKGLNDYQRFARKHSGYFGISDDGQIEQGVGHVHPSLSELTPAEVFTHYPDFNEEMMNRALVRDQIYDLWKVGQPYGNKLLGCVEVTGMRPLALTPPNIRRDLTYKEHGQLMRSSLNGLWLEYGGLGAAASGFLGFALAHFGFPIFVALIPILPAAALGRKKYKALYDKLLTETCKPNTQESSLVDMSIALLSAMQQVKLLPKHIDKTSLKVTQRSDGSYRVFLDDVEPEHSEYFAKSLKELLAPVTNQPYLIPKYEFAFEKEGEKQFFDAYLKGKAQPKIAGYHPVPSLLARSEKGRDAFQNSWNKYVSAGFVTPTESKPEVLKKYFGIGPSLAQRLLWE
jgi:superfamily II DNA or RNA helicase